MIDPNAPYAERILQYMLRNRQTGGMDLTATVGSTSSTPPMTADGVLKSIQQMRQQMAELDAAERASDPIARLFGNPQLSIKTHYLVVHPSVQEYMLREKITPPEYMQFSDVLAVHETMAIKRQPTSMSGLFDPPSGLLDAIPGQLSKETIDRLKGMI